MAGLGKGPRDGTLPDDAPNDDQEYSPHTAEASTHHPTPSDSPPTKYFLTVPTGWRIDASTALQEAATLPPAGPDSQHIGNDPHTRERELFSLRTPYLRELYQMATNEMADRMELPTPPESPPPPLLQETPNWTLSLGHLSPIPMPLGHSLWRTWSCLGH